VVRVTIIQKKRDISSHKKYRNKYIQVKRRSQKYRRNTLRCISSLLNFDALSAKRKKSLHQRL
jgi:hypothetical protein